MIIEIKSLNHDGLAPYTSLTEAQLRCDVDPRRGMFIAESPKVIDIALRAGYTPVSMLCEKRHITGDAAEILARCPSDMPVYTGSRRMLASLTGYTLTRGVLCAMLRRKLPSVPDVVKGARRIAIIDGVCDTTNIGAIFRSAAALGIDAVLLTPTSCDPLNRRAIRVSMGNIFLMPWTWLREPVQSLHDSGFKTVALALTDRSVPIDDPKLMSEPRLALVLGTEGDGLATEVIENTDYTARIPMSRGVDSLNVAAASAVAFWQLRVR